MSSSGIDSADLKRYVWEYLNDIGHTIPEINRMGNQTVTGSPENRQDRSKPIWHSKAELDRYVADKLGINMADYTYTSTTGTKKKQNTLYNAVASEIRRLRLRGALIDYGKTSPQTTGAKERGIGVWRLDKTKLDRIVSNDVRKEMRERNFHCAGRRTMVYVRAKQNVFREYLIKDYKRCAFCDFQIRDYLIGAHIVPYRNMRTEDPKNAMNPANGLALCRMCDVAFEGGRITVQPDYGIEISDHLSGQRQDPIRSWIGNVATELRLKKDMTYRPDPKYLRRKLKLVQVSKPHHYIR